jgi:hypothetical protein
MSSELEDSSLAIGTGGDDTDVGWVVNCNNNAGSQNDLFPAQVLALALV